MLLAAWYHPILAVLFAFVAVLLIIVILLQRGRGVGLAGAFGGSGGQSAFGAKTGDFLTWVTVGMAVVFLIFAVALNYAFRPGAPVGVRSAQIDTATPPPADAAAPNEPMIPTDDTTPAGGGETPHDRFLFP